jgi:hypothetical protein
VPIVGLSYVMALVALVGAIVLAALNREVPAWLVTVITGGGAVGLLFTEPPAPVRKVGRSYKRKAG